jgi:hypothetical protein
MKEHPEMATSAVDQGGGRVVRLVTRTGFEPWLGKREVADHFGRSTRWVELRIREGLPSKMIGGRRGFRLSDVEAWVDGRAR